MAKLEEKTHSYSLSVFQMRPIFGVFNTADVLHFL
jgi:hypothetical protein